MSDTKKTTPSDLWQTPREVIEYIEKREKWTIHEDEALIFGVERGHSRKEMAQTIGRNRRQLTKRLNYLKETGVLL
jgi:predicted transcriptional regulator